MSASSEEEDCSEINPITGRVNKVTPTTQGRYKVAYKYFMKWKADKNYESWTEAIILEYFTEKSKKYQPTTLWCTYSMLRSTIKSYHGIDISSYSKLIAFLKRCSVGFKSKKSKVLSLQNIERFLYEAPDSMYLAMKVALIFGINGSCNRNEICSVTINDVEEHGEMLLVKVKNTDKRGNVPRTFNINGKYYQIVKRYMHLRLKKGTIRFFQHYKQGKCMRKPIGAHTIGDFPKHIATFLGLPDPEEYTGHMYKRTSKMLQINKGECNLLSRLSQANPQEESYTETCSENCNKKFAKTTDVLSYFEPDETLAEQNHKVNSDSNKTNNERSNTEISNYEITFSPLPDNVKADPDLRPSYEDPLSPAADNQRSNDENNSSFTFENTVFDSDTLQNLCQTAKASDKNVFIFNNCTFNHCFK